MRSKDSTTDGLALGGSAMVQRLAVSERLAEATGLATFVDNDAKALALGEGWRGAAAGVDNFIAMVMSTGVGGGIVLDGRLLDGSDGNAGHIGHVVVVPGRPGYPNPWPPLS